MLQACTASELMTTTGPDAVLMEIGLPELEGWQVRPAARRDGFGESAPLLVAVTVYGSERDRTRSREAGFESPPRQARLPGGRAGRGW